MQEAKNDEKGACVFKALLPGKKKGETTSRGKKKKKKERGTSDSGHFKKAGKKGYAMAGKRGKKAGPSRKGGDRKSAISRISLETRETKKPSVFR